ncbi:protein RALF-like 28 [Capsella rubella]|uniref:protein RALF-like 28 n=1 Tax=Capsella rubella TaxID=81985 RepID=UPI000CD49F2D|nr:protein RALF-like 28 [Capsella rubella]
MSILKGRQKLMLVTIFIACVVISNMNVAAARVITYPTIGRGDPLPDCDHGKCPPQQVAPYRRGCERSQRCRGPPGGRNRKNRVRIRSGSFKL